MKPLGVEARDIERGDIDVVTVDGDLGRLVECDIAQVDGVAAAEPKNGAAHKAVGEGCFVQDQRTRGGREPDRLVRVDVAPEPKTGSAIDPQVAGVENWAINGEETA